MSENIGNTAPAAGGIKMTPAGMVVAGLGALLLIGGLLFGGGISFGGGSQVDVESVDSAAFVEPVTIPDGRYALTGEVVSRPANNTFVISVTSASAMGVDESWSFMGTQTGRGTAADFVGRLVVVSSPAHQVLDNFKIGQFYNAKGQRICQLASVIGEWDNTHSRFNLINAKESEKVGKPLSVQTFDPCNVGGSQYQSLTP